MESILNTDVNVLDNVLALNLNISLWSARKKLDPQDFGNVELPPDDLATLGSKRIAPPERLKIFTTIKARAVNFLDKHGIRFLGGWAIPNDKIEKILTELTQIKTDFQSEKETFLCEYDQIIEDWLEQHQEWKEILQNSTVSPDYVRSRMGFSWQIYKVSSASEQENTDISSGLQEEIHGLANTLFDDITKTANETWRKVYEGKSSVTHKALSPLRTLEQKLVGLSFVEPHVAPVADIIHTALSRVPARGNIIGQNLLALQGLVCLLRDKSSLLAHAEKLMEGHDTGEMLDGLVDDPELALAAFADITDIRDNSDIVGLSHTTRNIPVIADSYGLW